MRAAPPLGAAPRGRRTRPGAGPHSLSSDGRPAARQGMQTPHRSAALSVDASSLAVSCGSRGVSLDIGPASLFGTRDSARCPALRGQRQGSLPVRAKTRAVTWFPPNAGSTLRQRDRLRASTAVPRSRWRRPHPRATADVASRALRCVDRLCCSVCSEALGRHLNVGDAITPGLCPATSPEGDKVMRGIIAALHHAIISFFLTESLAATGPNPALRPVTTGPRRRPGASAGVVTGRVTSCGRSRRSPSALIGPAPRSRAAGAVRRRSAAPTAAPHRRAGGPWCRGGAGAPAAWARHARRARTDPQAARPSSRAGTRSPPGSASVRPRR